MSESVRKVGSVAILTTIFTSLSTALVLGLSTWVISQASDVKPLAQSVNDVVMEMKEARQEAYTNQIIINDQFSELTLLIYEQNTRMSVGQQRLQVIEDKCQSNLEDIENCKVRVLKGQ